MSDERVWEASVYAEGDIPEILRLIRAYYGDIDTTSEAFFRWQYEANPSGRVHLWLAKDKRDGKIIGQHVLLPMTASVEGKDVPAVLSFNALVDPTYHRQGIWSGLGDACYGAAVKAGVQFSYGVPNPNSRGPMVQKLAYRDLGDLMLMVHVSRPGPVAAAALSGATAVPGRLAAGALAPFLFRRSRPKGAWTVEEVRGFGSGFDALYERFRARYAVMIRRDASHLMWRYGSVPGRTYRTWVAKRGSEFAAYVVVRRTLFKGLDSGMVMDLAGAGPEAGDAELAVLLAAMEALDAEGVAAYFSFMVPSADEADVLKRAGFRRPPNSLLPQPFPLLVLPFAGEALPESATALGGWYFTIGDYDVF